METKICSKCKEEKEVCEFNKRNNSKDTLQSWCKICLTEYKKKYYRDNFENSQNYHKKYYKKNVDKITERTKKYREDNREIINEKAKQFYHKNKEAINEKRKQVTVCECGKKYRVDVIARHMKSQKHIKFLEQNNSQS